MRQFQQIRIAHGLSQRDICAKTGLSPGYVNDLEKQRRTPAPETARAIFEALEMSPEERRACIKEWHWEWITLYEESATPSPYSEER